MKLKQITSFMQRPVSLIAANSLFGLVASACQQFFVDCFRIHLGMLFHILIDPFHLRCILQQVFCDLFRSLAFFLFTSRLVD